MNRLITKTARPLAVNCHIPVASGLCLSGIESPIDAAISPISDATATVNTNTITEISHREVQWGKAMRAAATIGPISITRGFRRPKRVHILSDFHEANGVAQIMFIEIMAVSAPIMTVLLV